MQKDSAGMRGADSMNRTPFESVTETSDAVVGSERSKESIQGTPTAVSGQVDKEPESLANHEQRKGKALPDLDKREQKRVGPSEQQQKALEKLQARNPGVNV